MEIKKSKENINWGDSNCERYCS